MSEFNEKVYAIVRRIPPGKVMTYGQIAALLGVPRVARGVGWALNRVVQETEIPCQRVVNRNGGLAGGYGWGGKLAHQADLAPEGVEISPDFTLDLEKYQWRPTTEELGDLALSHELLHFLNLNLPYENIKATAKVSSSASLHSRANKLKIGGNFNTLIADNKENNF